MSTNGHFEALNNIVFTRCACTQHAEPAPYLLMVPLNQAGEPVWNQPQCIIHLQSAAERLKALITSR